MAEQVNIIGWASTFMALALNLAQINTYLTIIISIISIIYLIIKLINEISIRVKLKKEHEILDKKLDK